jgi:hypothetical protein
MATAGALLWVPARTATATRSDNRNGGTVAAPGSTTVTPTRPLSTSRRRTNSRRAEPPGRSRSIPLREVEHPGVARRSAMPTSPMLDPARPQRRLAGGADDEDGRDQNRARTWRYAVGTASASVTTSHGRPSSAVSSHCPRRPALLFAREHRAKLLTRPAAGAVRIAVTRAVQARHREMQRTWCRSRVAVDRGMTSGAEPGLRGATTEHTEVSERGVTTRDGMLQAGMTSRTTGTGHQQACFKPQSK